MALIKKTLIAVFFLTQSVWPVGDAGQEAAVLEMGHGSRAMALGSAYTAHGPDVSSLYWNPGGLGFIEKNEIATLHTMLATDASYYYLGGVFPGNYGNWGLSWAQLQLSDIPETEASPNAQNEVEVIRNLTYLENAGTLGYGQKVTEKLGLGLNFKYLSKTISDDLGEGRGYALSLGLLYFIDDRISLGFVADNVSNQQVYNTGRIENIPPKYRAGIGYCLNDWWKIYLDGEKRGDKDSMAKGHFGSEFLLGKCTRFLLGYDYNRLTAGAGFTIKGISMDYAYLGETQYALGSEQYVTLGVAW